MKVTAVSAVIVGYLSLFCINVHACGPDGGFNTGFAGKSRGSGSGFASNGFGGNPGFAVAASQQQQFAYQRQMLAMQSAARRERLRPMRLAKAQQLREFQVAQRQQRHEMIAQREQQRREAAAENAVDPVMLAGARTWTDSTGKYQVQAKMIGVRDGMVQLLKTDGLVVEVSTNQLSQADRHWLVGEIMSESPILLANNFAR